MPPAKGFTHVVQARLLGRRLHHRVLGLLDHSVERRTLCRERLQPSLGVPLLRSGVSLLGGRPLEGLGGAA